MKYLYLMLIMPVLCSCSLIKINEAPQLPKHRPEFIGVTDVEGGEEHELRFRVSDIVFYYDKGENCILRVRGISTMATVEANVHCNEIDAEIRK